LSGHRSPASERSPPAAPAWRIEPAAESDLAAILALIDADPISRARPGHQAWVTPAVRLAWEAIQNTADHALWVARAAEGVIGTLQFSRLPGLARDGMFRAIIESVHVDAGWRGRGVGRDLVQHAIRHARACGCGVVQLTSDKRRINAHRFYARLGFAASHEGMKLQL
jgi:GNAT superfamily N-acetyltransferase